MQRLQKWTNGRTGDNNRLVVNTSPYFGLSKMIEFECPTCQHTMRVTQQNAGKTGKCGRCKELVRVPDNRSDFIPSPSSATKATETVSIPAPETPPLPKDSWLWVFLFLLLGLPFVLGFIKAMGMIQYILYPALLFGISYLFYNSKTRNQVFTSCYVFDPIKRYSILIFSALFTFSFLISGDLDQPVKAHSATNNVAHASSKSLSTPPAEVKSEKPITTPEKKPDSTTYKVGIPFRLGDYQYTVHSLRKETEIGEILFDKFMGERASKGATFIIVSYTIENCSDRSQTVVADDFKLVDSKERTFLPSSRVNAALMMHTEDKDFFLSELQPGLPRKMQQGFEMPTESLEANITLVIPKKGLFSIGDARLIFRP